MSLEHDQKAFGCPHCGEVKLHPEMFRRLLLLESELRGNLPPVVTSYRCAEYSRQLEHVSESHHANGMAVSFETGNQYARHRVLLACLKNFDLVTVYPSRVAVALTEQPQPVCLTVL